MKKTDAPPPDPADAITLADAIVRISGAATKLANSGLNQRAIIVLLAHETKLGHSVVRNVLDHLAELKERYCR